MDVRGLTRATRSVPPARLEWLDGELAHWQREGLLDARAAAAIRGSYAASRRFSLGRLLLGLGAGFVGVGILWLVAANVDQLSPLVRFAGVVLVWLAAVVAGEVLAGRRATAAAAATRFVAALAFGAVVFQAAQSLQVPAYSSALLAWWGAALHLRRRGGQPAAGGDLGHVRLVRLGRRRADRVGGRDVRRPAAGRRRRRGCRGRARPRRAGRLRRAVATRLGAARADRPVPRGPAPVRRRRAGPADARLGRRRSGGPGRAAGRGPGRPHRPFRGPRRVRDRRGRGFVLRWQPPGGMDRPGELSGEALLRAAVAITVYLGAAAWFAALGVLRDAAALTHLAIGALVVFTAVQSFAVFAPILSGAALFLVLGAVLAGGGWLVDRGRRRLVAGVEEVAT